MRYLLARLTELVLTRLSIQLGLGTTAHPRQEGVACGLGTNHESAPRTTQSSSPVSIVSRLGLSCLDTDPLSVFTFVDLH